jgi:hypothetical protein
MKAFTMFAAMALAGCATDPRDIEPITRDYQPLLVNDCATLMDREANTQRDLDRYRDLQSNNRLADAVYMAIPAWRSRKADAKNERAIARLSGELEAVQTARAIRCAQGPTPSS